ncbi:M48 family peptidase, partial [Paraburkholderia sp. SIMBA_009]
AEIVVSAAVLVGLTLLGGVGALDTLLTGWFGRGYGQQVALVAAVLAITSVIDVPFEYYRQFGIEQRFGFNRMTRRLFFTDML